VVDIYNASNIGLDISQWDKKKFSGLNSENFRIFPACGTFFITDDSNEIREYYNIGEEIETYQDVSELKDKLKIITWLTPRSARRIALKRI